MVDAAVLNVTKRATTGKGAARALRAENKVPAVVYGGHMEELDVAIDEKELLTVCKKIGFKSRVFKLNLDGKEFLAIPRDVQYHPVTDRPLHADFQHVLKDQKIKVWVKVRCINHEQSPGLKRGGVLNIVRREVQLECVPGAIPEELVVDLKGAIIGQSIHISAVGLPEAAKPVIRDRDFTIVTIVGRVADEAAAAAPAAGAAAPTAAAPAAKAADKK